MDTPRYIQWTIPSLLYQARRNNPLVYKGISIGPGEQNFESKIVIISYQTV